MRKTKELNSEAFELSDKKSESAISMKSFITVVSLLLVLLFLSGFLSYVIPQGNFERDAEGMIVSGSFTSGVVDGIDVWRVVTAPFRVFVSEDALTVIMISVFLLIMSGVFNLL